MVLETTLVQLTGLSPPLKSKILNAVSAAIDEKDYVYGVKFTRWKTIAESRCRSFENARTDKEFAHEVNAAFNEFGESRLDLRTPKFPTERQAGNSTGACIYGQFEERGLDIYTFTGWVSPAEAAALKN